MIINLIPDSSVASAPSGFAAAIQAAATMLEQAISDDITINISYGWGSENNVVIPKLIGSDGAYARVLAGDVVSYSTLRSWLTADSTSAQDASAISSLPANNSSFPDGNNSFFVSSAQQKALGHFTGSSTTIDGAIAFGTAVGSDSWVNVALHEITHAMGRISLRYATNPVILDMFSYDAAGHFQWTEGSLSAAPSYFSIDGGQTRLADFGETSDYSDFLNSGVQGPNDPFNEFYHSDTLDSLTALDITTMDVIGFDRVGVTPPSTDDFRDSLTDTGVFGSVVVNGSATGRLEVNGDRDWFQIQLTAGTPHLITLQGQQGGGGTLYDPYLRVYNNAGALLVENDDIVLESNLDSQLTFTPNTTGTYYLEAAAFDDNFAGTYRVSVSAAGATDDFRDSLTDSGSFGAVVVNGSSTGTLEVAGDRDWFSINLNAGTTYVINLQGLQAGGGTLADPYLRLHNSTGALLAQNDDIVLGSNRDSQLSFAIAETGTYYIEAGAFDDGYTGTYRISVNGSTTPADDFRDSLTDNTAPFGQVAANGSITGNVEASGDRDWFQVQLNAGVSYLIDLQGLRAGEGTLEDPYLRLHDSSGALLAENDDIELGVDRDSRLTYQATASGTHYIEAGAFDDDYTGTYRVSVSGGRLITLGANPETVIGAAGDTIVGGSGSALINAIAGPESIIGGAGNTTVWAGTGDSIVGGAGSMTVAGNGDKANGSANNVTITGGAGNLTAFNLGTGDSVIGSTSGFTFVDDNYGGSGNTIAGGAGKGTVTTPLGSTVAAGSYIIGGKSDVIAGGSGTMLVNALGGAMTINGGAGDTTVWGSAGNKITGGSGAMQVNGDKLTVTGGPGSLLVFGGSTDSVIGGSGSTTVIGGTGNTVSGGTGPLQFNAGSGSTVIGGAGNLSATDLGKGNSVVGSSSGKTFIDDSYVSTTTGAFTGGNNTLVGGAGNSTITAGPGDIIIGGAGSLEALIRSDLTGSETVNLSAAGTNDGVRDISVVGGAGASVTVTGFSTVDDRIESATSTGAGLIATATTDGSGNVVLHFVDSSTMTLVGVTDATKITFTG